MSLTAPSFPQPHRAAFRRTLIVFMVAFAVLHLDYVLRFLVTPPAPATVIGAGDAFEYDHLARSLLSGEGFANQMWGLRTPLYPLFAAAIYGIGGQHYQIVLFFNIILGALSAAVVFKTLRLLIDPHFAFAGALLMAVEAGFVVSVVALMSEPLHNLLLWIGLFWFVRFLRWHTYRSLLLSAVSIGLALFTRPITGYLVVILAAIMLVHSRRLWKQAALLIIIGAVFYSAWSYRNLVYTGNFSLSTTGSYTTLFYKMVSVESHATHRDPTEVATDIALIVERRMGNTGITREEIAKYPVGRPENLYSNDPRREAIFREMIQERLRAYPMWFVISTGVSLAREFGPAKELLLPTAVQVAQMGVVLLLAAVGYFYALKRWRAMSLFLVLSHAVVLYYAGLSALALGGAWHARIRTPFFPFVAAYAGIGLLWLIQHAVERWYGSASAALAVDKR